MANDVKSPVTEHAIIARINRKLMKDGQFLRKTRSNSHIQHEYGTYYLVDSYKHIIGGTDDLATYAAHLGALAPGEYLVEHGTPRR